MTEQGTVPQMAASGSDEQALLQRLRDGEDAAFGELFELHAAAVRRLARSLASDQSEAEDITAETFFRVLQALRRGAGPRDYIRAYLLTVARRVSWEWHGARRDVPVSDDELTFRAGADADTNARTAEHSLITRAFTSLPERWRTVLWQTEVEGEQPAMVAPHFGLSANATAALARRARQGLRAAYLQAHLSVGRSSDGCRAVVEKLGGFTAGSVTGAEAQRIRAHLVGCSSCRNTHDELRDVCSSLRANAGAVLLLVPTAAFTATKATGGALAAVKSLLIGSKVKVGMALASTAAAGAFGIAVGPAMFDSDQTQAIGLEGHGGAGPELGVVKPAVEVPDAPKVEPASDHLSVHGPNEVAGGDPVEPRLGGDVPADVPEIPAGGQPGAQIPAGQASAPPSGTATDPRSDTGSHAPVAGGTTASDTSPMRSDTTTTSSDKTAVSPTTTTTTKTYSKSWSSSSLPTTWRSSRVIKDDATAAEDEAPVADQPSE
ncbi:sigma-70 family RNA polymerase sigma factor [Amycolatopsis sp. cg5]|uniref:sigma-70 family RNA polymerase sigma factor n=1 Tax=Amycolatopsis sp. cg5 TaxID=3238802 RepID=UPI0035234032